MNVSKESTTNHTPLTASQADAKLADIVEQYMVAIQTFVEPIRSVQHKLRQQNRRGAKLSPSVRKKLQSMVARAVGTPVGDAGYV